MELQNKRKKSCMYMHRFIAITFTQSGVTEIIQYRLPVSEQVLVFQDAQ